MHHIVKGDSLVLFYKVRFSRFDLRFDGIQVFEVKAIVCRQNHVNDPFSHLFVVFSAQRVEDSAFFVSSYFEHCCAVMILEDALVIINCCKDTLSLHFKHVIVPRVVHIMACRSNYEAEENFLRYIEDVSAIAVVKHPVEELNHICRVNGVMVGIVDVVHFLKGESEVAHHWIWDPEFKFPVILLVEELEGEVERVVIRLFVSQESIVLKRVDLIYQLIELSGHDCPRAFKFFNALLFLSHDCRI